MSPTVWRTAQGDVEGRLDAEFYLPKHLAMVQRVRKVGAKKLADLEQCGSYGVLPKSEEYGTGPVPLVRGGDLTGMPLTSVPDDAPRVPARYLSNKRGRLGPEEVLLLVKGATIDAPQSVGIVPASWNTPAVVNGSVYKFQVRAPADPYFVAAFFGTPFGLSQKTRAIANTGINYNDQDSIRAFWVPQPDPDIQRAIGNKLRKAERLREVASGARSRADQVIGDLMKFGIAAQPFLNHGWRPKGTVDQDRLDAWFHRPEYVWRARVLANQGGLRSLRSICKNVTKPANVGRWPSPTFDYFEIGGIDATTGEALSNAVPLSEAPSRAKYVVQAGDLLVSTVRPNLKKVGQIDPNRAAPGVATSGFSVWRPPTPEIGAFLRACLVHEVGVEQLMRWNSGGTYPAIDADVPGRVLVPFDEDQAREVGHDLLQALVSVREAGTHVDAAKAAVEALIDGTLDDAALLSESDAIEQWLAENPSPSKGA